MRGGLTVLLFHMKLFKMSEIFYAKIASYMLHI